MSSRARSTPYMLSNIGEQTRTLSSGLILELTISRLRHLLFVRRLSDSRHTLRLLLRAGDEGLTHRGDG